MALLPVRLEEYQLLVLMLVHLTLVMCLLQLHHDLSPGSSSYCPQVPEVFLPWCQGDCPFRWWLANAETHLNWARKLAKVCLLQQVLQCLAKLRQWTAKMLQMAMSSPGWQAGG